MLDDMDGCREQCGRMDRFIICVDGVAQFGSNLGSSKILCCIERELQESLLMCDLKMTKDTDSTH